MVVMTGLGRDFSCQSCPRARVDAVVTRFLCHLDLLKGVESAIEFTRSHSRVQWVMLCLPRRPQGSVQTHGKV